MYCNKCGAQIPDGSKFCNNCGAAIGYAYEAQINEDANNVREIPFEPTPPIGHKKKNSTWKYILIAVLAVLAAWRFGFIDFGPSDEDNYKQGVAYYEMHDYDNAKTYFGKLDEGYKSTELYNILCQGHIYEYLTDEQIRTLKQHLDFEDTKSLLLSNDYIAFSFLNGYWTTDDGKRYFEFYEQGEDMWTHYNLPADEPGDGYFYITDGMYGVDVEKDGDTNETEKVDMFRISILGADKIAVVALKDNSRYVMTRDS